MDMAITVCQWLGRFAWRIIKTVGGFFLFKLGGYWFIICSIFANLIMAWQFENSNGAQLVIVDVLCSILMIIDLVFCTGMFIYSVIRYFKRRKDPSWGYFSNKRAASASKHEISVKNPEIPKELLSDEPDGVFFGVQNPPGSKKQVAVCQPVTMDGHVLVLGGSGSGKSSCLAIPVIKTWSKPMLVIDIKPELAEKGLSEEKMNRTKIFNPTEPMRTYGFDPFSLAKSRTKNYEVIQDVKDLALAIIPDTQPKDPYWEQSARSILYGILLYGLKVKNWGFIETLEWAADNDPRDVVTEICECDDKDCRMGMKSYVKLPDNTLGSIWNTMSLSTEIFYQDDMIKNALQKEDYYNIKPSDLDEGYNIFIQVPENKLDIWKGLMTVLMNTFLKHFEGRDERDPNLTPILFLIDEAPRLGKISLPKSSTTLRSRKVHLMVFAQNISQFDKLYGKEDRLTLMSNMTFKCILNALEPESAKILTEMAGVYDKQVKSYSTNQQDMKIGGGSGTSRSEQQRKIINPEEWGSLPNTGQMVLFNTLSDSTFCRVYKQPYYTEEGKELFARIEAQQKGA